MLRWAKNKKKTRRQLKTHILHPICLFTLKYWASTSSFLPANYTSSDWSSRSEPELPERYPLPRSGCARNRWRFTSLLTPALDVYPVPAPLGSAGSCWWVKLAQATEKPTRSAVVMSATVQDMRHQSTRALPGHSLQQPRPMLDVQSFPRLPKVHRITE